MSTPEADPDVGSYALFPLRLGLAVIFIAYGWNKFTALAGVTDMFDAWGIPLPAVSAFLVAVAEVFGGLGLLLGVLPRFSAGVLSVVMVTALTVVKIPGPLAGGFDIDLALLVGTLTILLAGPGRPTLGSMVSSPDGSLWGWLKARLGPNPAD